MTPDHLLPSLGPIFYDAFIVLLHVSAVTTNVRLGTTVAVVPYRNPIVLAKMVSTLDVLSGGRVILGIGAGGAPDEFQALGVPSNQRGRITNEYLDVMVNLWTQDPCSFQGRFVSYSGVRFEPKPSQRPHVPVWVGGRSEAALERAVAVGEAWHPTSMALDSLAGNMRKLRTLAESRGRRNGPLTTVHQTIRLVGDGSDRHPARTGPRRSGEGSVEEVTSDIDGYHRLGVSEIVCNFGVMEGPKLHVQMKDFSQKVMACFPEMS